MAGLRPLLARLDRRRRLIAVLGLGWAAVIISGTGAAPSPGRWLGLPPLGRYLLPLVIAYAIIGFGLFVAMLVAARRDGTQLPERKPRWPLLLLLAAFILLANRLPDTGEIDSGGDPPRPADETEIPSLRTPVIGRGELVGVLFVMAGAVAIIVWTRRRIDAVAGPVEETSPGDDLEPIIGHVVQRLELGTDPRSAVIDAYARLEEALGDRGEPRRPAETPTEHVSRALARFPIERTPIRRLAGLYEVARFSDHEVTVDDQQRAAAALRRARSDLDADHGAATR